MGHAKDADDRVKQVAILVKLNRAFQRLQIGGLDRRADVRAADGLTTFYNSRNSIDHDQPGVICGEAVVGGLFVPTLNVSVRPRLSRRSIQNVRSGRSRIPSLGGGEPRPLQKVSFIDAARVGSQNLAWEDIGGLLGELCSGLCGPAIFKEVRAQPLNL